MAPTTKKFQCIECKHEVQRPLAPMTCPACGKQRVGLFKQIGVGAAPVSATSVGVPPPGQGNAAKQNTRSQQIASPKSGQPHRIASPPIPSAPVSSSYPASPHANPAATAQGPLKSSSESPQAKSKKVTSKQSPAAAQPPRVPDQTPSAPPTAPPRASKTRSAPPLPPEPPRVEQSVQSKKPVSAKPHAIDIPTEEADTFSPAAASSDRVAWQYPEVPPTASKRRPLRNCVAVASNGNIIAAIGAKVVALEEKEGKVAVKWNYSTGNRIPGSPSLGADDSVHVHAADGMLHCLSAAGEQVYAPSNVGKPLGWASPVVDTQKNTWICGYSGGLMKLSSDGSHINRRFFRSREKFDSTGVLHNDVFYVGCDDGFVYAIKLEDRRGHNLWDQRAGRGLTEWFVNSSPAIGPGSTIIACSRDDCVYGFNFDGEQLWRRRVSGQMLASAVVDPQGRILVTVSRTRRGEKGSGALVCISGNSHQIEWEYPTDSPSESTPVVGSDKITYFGDNSGIIHAVDHEGNRVWTANLGSPVRSAGSIIAPQRVVFGLDNETLVALECSSKGLAEHCWPKYMGTLRQSGSTTG